MFRKKPFLILFITALAIKLFSLYPAAVENIYSTGIYPWLAWIQRLFFGWIPFSVGDLLYGVIVIWMGVQLYRFSRHIRQRKANRAYLVAGGQKAIYILLVVYIAFNALWGLNYNRKGIAYQMELEISDYTKEDLVSVMDGLAQKLNALDTAARRNRDLLEQHRVLFAGAISAYDGLAAANRLFIYSVPSVKPSLYSRLGNWLGFTGYYNPFTGEAQVNTAVPAFIQPFVTCHEIGHQLGYARESEANFAGFLSASASGDPRFQYAMYFDMYAYAGRYLYRTDSLQLKNINARLSPAVKKDFEDLRAFFLQYANPVEVWIDRLYGQYLKANQQPSGKMSYNEVVSLLIAYHKKHGRF